MALNSNLITIWKDKNNIKTIGTGSIKDENGNYTNFSLSEVYTKDGKMLGLGLNMQVALYYQAEGKKFALNTIYKQPINVKTTTDLLQRFDKKISVAFKNPGDESAGKSANYNLVFNDPKDKKQDGLAFWNINWTRILHLFNLFSIRFFYFVYAKSVLNVWTFNALGLTKWN